MPSVSASRVTPIASRLSTFRCRWNVHFIVCRQMLTNRLSNVKDRADILLSDVKSGYDEGTFRFPLGEPNRCLLPRRPHASRHVAHLHISPALEMRLVFQVVGIFRKTRKATWFTISMTPTVIVSALMTGAAAAEEVRTVLPFVTRDHATPVFVVVRPVSSTPRYASCLKVSDARFFG